ncbi:hypothetical protein BDQ17DRAFT_1325651 [Cyathus striatus]|nr:hypothetical protein BDQ17DRAFT_1325651 [Cyathus striatus]
MPETTNAVEAQHWKIYCTQGHDHLFKNGLYSLHAVAESYDTLFKATTNGAIIHYGQANHWKSKRCKSHNFQKKNEKSDERPPDTPGKLLPPPERKRKAKKMTGSHDDMDTPLPKKKRKANKDDEDNTDSTSEPIQLPKKKRKANVDDEDNMDSTAGPILPPKKKTKVKKTTEN